MFVFCAFGRNKLLINCDRSSILYSFWNRKPPHPNLMLPLDEIPVEFRRPT